jgi:hypothetical protein
VRNSKEVVRKGQGDDGVIAMFNVHLLLRRVPRMPHHQTVRKKGLMPFVHDVRLLPFTVPRCLTILQCHCS